MYMSAKHAKDLKIMPSIAALCGGVSGLPLGTKFFLIAAVARCKPHTSVLSPLVWTLWASLDRLSERLWKLLYR